MGITALFLLTISISITEIDGESYLEVILLNRQTKGSYEIAFEVWMQLELICSPFHNNRILDVSTGEKGLIQPLTQCGILLYGNVCKALSRRGRLPDLKALLFLT